MIATGACRHSDRYGTRRRHVLPVVTLAAMLLVAGAAGAMAQPRAHVYLFRGLADVFSLGMDTLADELNRRGIDATSHSHTDWRTIASRVVIDYKAGKEGPIVIVGHSLGADAAMEMADYLGDRGVPVALVAPFDATQSFPVPANVARVINFTQRDYAFMRPGPGFRGSLTNVDLRNDPKIGHLNIDESPKLHNQVIGAVLALVGGHSVSPVRDRSREAPGNGDAEKKQIAVPERKPADDRNSAGGPPNSAKEDAPSIADKPTPMERPARSAAPASAAPPVSPPAAPRSIDPAQIPD